MLTVLLVFGAPVAILAATVGEIEMVPAKDLADKRPEYKDLAKIDAEIPTIVLNRTYSPLKSYVQARAAELTEEGKEQARERYAVGVGVASSVAVSSGSVPLCARKYGK